MSKVAIIDFGSQFTQLIARCIREMNVYSEIFSPDASFSEVTDFDAFILSGGPDSVDESKVPTLVMDILQHNELHGTPVLGICYGLQLIANCFGTKVKSQHNQEFGRVRLRVLSASKITDEIWPSDSEAEVWMSHSDSINQVPRGFEVIATTVVNKTISIIQHNERSIYGVQFHPEVTHTTNGRKLLSNFLDVAGCQRDWSVKSFMDEEIARIKTVVGKKKVIAAVSGGVDSSVAATLTYRAIGSNLHCIFIDTGLLRRDEAKHVKELLVDRFSVPISFIDKSELFLGNLKGVVDPEEKRKIIGRTFIEVFEEEAKKIAGADFLMQGTLYPDVIESGCASQQKSAKIKSHHNVGGLPENMNLKLLEPLRYLFKDEVRMLGRELGLPDDLIMRHPFPGPGLAVRILGEVDKDKIDVLQQVDDIFINTMKNFDLYGEIWQAFSVLLPVKSVGVMGDGRTYNYVCALRAVTSMDGMTADAFPFECKEQFAFKFWDFLQNVSAIIVNNVKAVNRVVYDITSKPPATIEWE